MQGLNRHGGTEGLVLLALLCVPALFLLSATASGQESDRFGGRACEELATGDRFRLESLDGRSWLVTPDGGRFLSFGVNHVAFNGDTGKGTGARPYRDAVLAKFKTPDKWAQAVCGRLRSWGFNTIGAWSDSELNQYLPRTPILHLTQAHWSECWRKGSFPDFFDPAFVEYVEDRARGIERNAGDPFVLGYFIDNELPWAPDHRNMPELFDGYVALPKGTAGKERLVEFMKRRYVTVGAFNKVWGPAVDDWSALSAAPRITPTGDGSVKADREDFTLLVARQYFKVTTDAIHARDPGRLVLGCRFIPLTVPRVVVQACGEYCDVVSVNYYEPQWGAKAYFALQGSSVERMPRDMDLSAFYAVGKKPLMVTEFTSRLEAEGHNSWPPSYAIQPVVKTQKERAARFEKQVMTWMSQPWFVGAHWFQHADQPKEGRAGDGEDSIFGLVNVEDEPYGEFVDGVADVIGRAWEAHGGTEAIPMHRDD